MKLSNIHNLPKGIFQAVVDSVQRPQPDIIRVTELINPPICKKLALKHWDTIEADASEFLWSLLGSGVHAVLAKQEGNVIIERRSFAKIYGVTLTGQIDRFDPVICCIEDYKCTSVWSYLFGTKPEWIAQLNLYKFLLEQEGYIVKKLTINAILRDWQLSKAIQKDYPAIPFQMIDVPMWSPIKIRDYIEERVAVHQSDPLPCSPAERWQRNSTFAIMKTGRKSAVRVLDTEDEAIVHLSGNKIKEVDKKKCEIVERVGEAVKCKSYCLCRDVCPHNFYKKENS